jgi:thymidine kinase
MAKLYFYYSAMNAGKTTTLLQSAYNYQERGMRTLLFTPLIDNRFKEGWIASRIGLKSKAVAFTQRDDLLLLTRQSIEREGPVGCVMTDESQFLSKAQVYQLTEIVDQLDVPVLAYGLRTDFRGELFEGSQYLLAWADTINEIKTICHTGKKATMVVRVDEHGEAYADGAQVEIGGNERYVSVSRKEFKELLAKRRKLEPMQQNLPLENDPAIAAAKPP